MPLLHRAWDDRPISSSLDHPLAFYTSLESWSLVHPTLTLLPPFQPPPKSRPFHPLPPPLDHHQNQHALTGISTPEQKPPPHHHLSHRQRRYDRSSRRSLDCQSFASDQSVVTIDEEEDIRVHIRSVHVESARFHSTRSTTPPVSPIAINSPPNAAHPSFGRPLTFVSTVIGDEMTTVSTTPDSPPELSGSKSSKSSSYNSSSQLSSADGAADISNFEDIGLGDDTQNPNEVSVGSRRRLLKRPTSHPIPIATVRNKVDTMTSMRDLTLGKRSYPSLRHQVDRAVSQEIDDGLVLPPRRSTAATRGFSSPSMPMLSKQKSERPRSRSRSPAAQDSLVNGSSTSLGRPPSSPRKLQPNGRRQSWQPSRKTIKELEAEYHDSDDDLPEDTNLWNVPMSPRPFHERASSRASSRHGSPERPSPGPLPQPFAHAVSDPAEESAIVDSPQLPSQRHSLPPRKSSLYSPPPAPNYQQTFRDSRAKSWTLAMSDLSEEARILTENLEYHADNVGRQHDEQVQRGKSKSARPSLESTARHSKTAIELPPLQRGNVMIDPLPISKEKEKVLTRTRPSWLPPKDPKEEKRHLKEYQRMMAASMEAEKKRETKEQSSKVEKDDARAEHHKIWEQYVYPEWNKVISEPRTRELWWEGVSPKMRGAVWQRAVGNELALSEGSYDKALKRAYDLRQSPSQDDETQRARQWFAEIAKDATTVYPDLNLFQRGSPMHDSLIDLLSAYAMYRNDVGYLHGLHLIAAVILLQVSTPANAFILLANCLNRPLLLACLTSDPVATSRTYKLTHQALSYKYPRVSQYLFNSPDDKDPRYRGLGLIPAQVFESIFRTLLSNGLELERLSRIWDAWVFEGDRTIVRATVAVLGLLEAQICLVEGKDLQEQKDKVLSLLSWGPWGRRNGMWDFRGMDGGDADGFMVKVREAGRMQ